MLPEGVDPTRAYPSGRLSNSEPFRDQAGYLLLPFLFSVSNSFVRCSPVLQSG